MVWEPTGLVLDVDHRAWQTALLCPASHHPEGYSSYSELSHQTSRLTL